MDQSSVPVTFLELLWRLGLAFAVGVIIGFDRELHRKPAGIRTHTLVALGSCLFTVVALLVAVEPTLDVSAPGRVIQGIIAGVGFIGAGAIFRQTERFMGHGLTTAASIWMVAALGTAAGMGLWRTTLVTVAMALAVLLVGDPVDRFLERRRTQAEARERMRRKLEEPEVVVSSQAPPPAPGTS
jgi:putative Mg2+ transporter-C (MgtC) family protein